MFASSPFATCLVLAGLSLAGCGLCDRFSDQDEHGDCGGANPIGGAPSELTLPGESVEGGLVRPPRRCTDAVFETHVFEVLAFGEEIAPREWMVDELRPVLSERGLSTGWGLSGCDGSALGLIVNDWGVAQEIAEVVLELAAQDEVSVSISITVEQEAIYCAQDHDACQT